MVKISVKPWLWLRRRWGRKGKEKQVVGVLSFEVSRLMSKTVNLWQALSDDRIAVLRDETLRIQGVRKLVSNEDEFLVSLVLAETMDAVHLLARAVSRLGIRCSDPVLHRFEHVFADLIKNDSDLCGLEYQSMKRMKREVKRMEEFVAASSNLYQEIEMLAELENDFRRMQAIPEMTRQGCSLSAFKKRVSWQRQNVKNLQDVSVWNRSYDYVARILARALFTIVARIKLVFGFQRRDDALGPKATGKNSGIYHSVSDLLQSSFISSNIRGVSSFASGPLMSKNRARRGIFGQIPLTNHRISKPKWSVSGSNATEIAREEIDDDDNASQLDNFNMKLSLAMFESKRRLLQAPPLTLGAAALALQYANVIVVIENLASSPNSIGPDVRDELYSMLPRSIRMSLRMRLSSYANNLSSSVYDPTLAGEWREAMAKILEWLAPLAHNMINWQSERKFEKQHLISITNVLLMQTLYYANQAKTESAITELLVGLNYLWRSGREIHANAALDSVGLRASVRGGRRRE